jgi:hypothetical protein
MTYRSFSSRSIRIGGALLLGALLVVAVIAPLRPVKAQGELVRQRRVSPPVKVNDGYSVQMACLNASRDKLLGVRFYLMSAPTGMPMASSPELVVAPGRAGTYAVQVDDNAWLYSTDALVGDAKTLAAAVCSLQIQNGVNTVAILDSGYYHSHEDFGSTGN